MESRELANIERALEQMREGNYGVCELCSSSIPLARLQALPYATTCINCQREAEESGDVSSFMAEKMPQTFYDADSLL